MTAISLFSGIGGLDLAAHWAGVRTVQMVESDAYCQRVLRKHWPKVQIYDDIKSFSGLSFRGNADIIFGGFPCQDISICNPDGKGLEGSRSILWFEMLRVIEEIRPPWVVVENVPNLINMGIDVCLAGLENLGYATTTIDFPASAVGACHRRYRLAIVAYDPAFHNTGGERRNGGDVDQGGALPELFHVVNPGGGRCEREPRRGAGSLVTDGYIPLRQDFWWQWPAQPLLRRGDDGFPSRVDRTRGVSATPRQAFEMRVRGLGNAVCPQQFFPVFDAIYKSWAKQTGVNK